MERTRTRRQPSTANVRDQPSISNAEQLWGKELSYNNIMDADAALDLIMEFDNPACVILKHSQSLRRRPVGEIARRCIQKCISVDTVSAFGGIVGLNRTVDADTARAIGDVFTEVVIAPDYTKEALAILDARRKISGF